MEVSLPHRRKSNTPSTIASRVAHSLRFRSHDSVSAGSSETLEEKRGSFGLVLLSSPSDPIVDFVFVHGLKGGSRKTWSESSNPLHFWPKEWLPRDPDFRHVRIHSFGYNSDWSEKRESPLHIHDFGKSLLGALQDSPLIRRDASLPLVMVGHSMGGLVIKKAYILARHDQVYHNISERFHTLFFIATPHRGADSAELLSNVLRAAARDGQPYVQDLHRNSASIETINDEFRHICDRLKLYSFYETVPTNLKIKTALIVEKDSAILGYPGERTAYITADHRGVVKFASPESSNYLILRNAFVSTIDEISERWSESKAESQRDQKRRLESFLGVNQKLEDEYLHYSDLRVKDSCDWLIEKESFQNWRDSDSSNVYWLSANPASGKSVMAAHVINHLDENNLTCSYFFFTQDSKVESNISTCLRSIAYQMALSNVYVRDNILAMIDDGVQIPMNDFRAIWRKLFIGGILRTTLYQPYYWVLDGLDECEDRQELIRKLEEIEQGYPLRIFLTSRPSSVPPQHSGGEGLRMHVESVSEQDSEKDIRSLVEANMHQFPAKDDAERQELIQEIVNKADGCFLWVKLVVDELRNVYSLKDVRRILDGVPVGMDALYSRILKKIEQSQYGQETAKAILTWTALSAKPLRVDELDAALLLDIEDSPQNLAESAAPICGHLVYVDSKSRVRMIHQTAREFLLGSKLSSKFALNRNQSNTRLATICLEYLIGDEMKAPRRGRPRVPRATARSPFADYACVAFYEHVRGTSSTEDSIFKLLHRFLMSSNVLCWIESIAQTGDPGHLVRAGKLIKDFLRRRTKHVSPLGEEFEHVNSWSIDILRLAFKFGQELIMAPWSIYTLIPPFCPPNSAIHKQFGASSHSLTCKGLSLQSWDDRISCYVAHGEQTSSVAYTDKHYAIGYSSGLVLLFQASTCQVVRRMYHGEHIKSLQFSHSGRLLASGGMKSILVFNVHTGDRLITLESEHQCLALQFDSLDQSLQAALRNSETKKWEVPSGALLSTTMLSDEPVTGQSVVATKAPNAATFSSELKLLAIVFRAPSIILWDLESDTFYGYLNSDTEADKTQTSHTWPLDAVFSPAPNTSRLAATYWGGELVLFDPEEGGTIDRTIAGGEVLSSSPDGRILASGDSAGNIQLFEFETLKLLYRVNSWDYGIKSLAFSEDGLRFIDIRGSTCNVWEPPELIKQDTPDQSSDSDALSSTAKEVDLADDDDLIMITTVAVHPTGRFILCGKDDGSVCLYNSQTGLQIRVLYRHAQGAAVTHLKYAMATGVVISSDDSGMVCAYRLSNELKVFGGLILRVKMEEAVTQLLIQNKSLTIITSSTIALYRDDGKHLKSYTREQRIAIQPDSEDQQHPNARHTDDLWRWSITPSQSDRITVLDGDIVSSFTMQHLESSTQPSLPLYSGPESLGAAVTKLPSTSSGEIQTPQTIVPCFNDKYFAMSWPSPDSLKPPSFMIWPVPLASANPVSPDAAISHLSGHLSRIIGSFGSKLVFIDRQNWVSSIDLNAEGYTRHFCIPFDWLSTNELQMEVTQTIVVFIRRNELAVVRNGFTMAEPVPLP